MSGQNHAGNYDKSSGCHCVNCKGMVETREESAYSITRCFSYRLEIEGKGLRGLGIS